MVDSIGVSIDLLFGFEIEAITEGAATVALFTDNFNVADQPLRTRTGFAGSGDASAQDDIAISGNQVVINKVVGREYAVLHDTTSADHRVKARHTTAGTNNNKIYARCTDSNNGVGWGPYSNGNAELVTVIGSNTTRIDVYAVAGGAQRKTYELRIIAGRAYGYVDGVLITPAGGVDVSGVPTSNKVGFTTEINSGSWDDFEADAVAATTLTVTDYAAFRVFQRVGTAANVAVSGTYPGVVSALEYRVENYDTGATVRDWTTLVTAPTGNSYNQLVSLPVGGWYRVKVRSTDAPATVVQTEGKFAVGAVLLVDGQSNAQRLVNGSGGTPNSLTAQHNGTAWGAPSGIGMVALANAVQGLLNVPVALVNTAVGSTDIAQHTPTGALWPGKVIRIDSAGGDIEAALWSQGESDAANGATGGLGDFSNSYSASLQAYANGLLLKTGRTSANFKVLVAVTGRKTDANSAYNLAYQYVRDGQEKAALALPSLIKISHYCIDLPIEAGDTLHYSYAAGYPEHARRWARSYAYHLSASSYDARGPFATSVERTGNVIDVTLNLNGATTLADRGVETGWKAYTEDLVTEVSISSIEVGVPAANKIRVTLASNPPTVYLRHLPGANPDVANLVLSDVSA